MSISIANLNSYNKLFASSTNKNVNTTTNLMYGAAVTSMYVQRLTDFVKSDLSTYLSSLNTNISELKSSSQSLIENDKNSIFNTKKVSSDNPAISGTADKDAHNKTYMLSVTKLAQSQKNTGFALSSDIKTSLSAGTNSVKISKGGKETSVSFDVEYDDTNKEALGKMANAINNAGLGITARVVSDNTQKTSHLQIISDNSGANESFTISDQSGNSVLRSGANQITAKAADAQYEVDGKTYTSNSNTIELDDGNLKISLNSVTEKDIKIAVSEDKEGILNTIKSFASKYNKAIDFEHDAGSYAVSTKFGQELKSIVSSKRGSLAGIGINVKSNDTLEIDEKKLSKSLDEDPSRVKRLIGGFDGIAYKTKKLSEKTLAATAFDTTDNNSFPNYLRIASKSSLQRVQSMGLFVDTLL